MHQPPPHISTYWGKARSGADDHAAAGEPDWHPAAYHMLDVAAVAARLVEARPDLATRAERVLPGLPGLLPLLAGLHDLGKLSTWFQDMRPDLVERLTGAAPEPSAFKGFRHGEAGLLFWTELPALREAVATAGGCSEQLLDVLLPASFGHHGQPPAPIDNVTPPLRGGDGDILALAGELASLLAPAEPVAAIKPKLAHPAAWFTAGACILADWIGSNRRWFPFRAPDLSLADYYHTVARPAAAQAVADAGLEAPAPTGYHGFTTLFPTLPPEALPSPLQRLCETLPIANGPQIVVVEDVTGSGKTEAALILAARMMAAGQGSRVFVGLPTQATADAMFKRLGDSYRCLFAEGARPTMSLAHGRAGLHEGFREAVLAGRQPEADSQGRDERDTASVLANSWLADNRKKALLADVGVGTLDQALLGALPVRHQALRLLGSSGGILVVDEVHAYDAYTGRLLAGLLTFHAALGGSAVVMSATLAGHQRRALIEAFAAGRGKTLDEDGADPAAAPYPLVTRWSEAEAAPVAEQPPPDAPLRRPPRRLRCTRLSDEAAAVAVLVETARAGGCGCWVRNTIKDARKAFAALAEHLPADDLLLFHAAFIPADRSAVETRVLDHFGKASTDTDRRGRILVATQVVEQSLDLDFDTLVTDLAPIDLVIQRAGRQHRHPDLRPPRPEPVLHVLGPQAVTDPAADWYETMFEAAAHVYKDAGRLWLTQHLLTGTAAPAAGWDLVADARRLIETVYGPDSLDAVPPGLQESSCGDEGTRDAHRWLAGKTMLRPDRPFALRDTAWDDEIRARTRLGDERVPLVLAVEGAGGTLLPLSRADRPDDGDPADPFERRRAWAESEISISARRPTAAAPPPPHLAEAAAALRRDLGWRDDRPLLVVLTPDADAPPGSGGTGTILRDGRPATLRYRRETGLALS